MEPGDSISDDMYWQRLDLGEETSATISPRGLVIVKQTTSGEHDTVYLDAQQMSALIAAYAARLTPNN